MYIHISIYIFTCMYIPISICVVLPRAFLKWLRICIYGVSLLTYLFTYLYMNGCLASFISTYTFLRIWIKNTYLWICVCVYTWLSTCIHVFICMHAYISICTYLYISRCYTLSHMPAVCGYVSYMHAHMRAHTHIRHTYTHPPTLEINQLPKP